MPEGLSAPQEDIAHMAYNLLLAEMKDIPASCPIEDCVWKEREKKFWQE